MDEDDGDAREAYNSANTHTENETASKTEFFKKLLIGVSARRFDAVGPTKPRPSMPGGSFGKSC
jgi:hypothetical protein